MKPSLADRKQSCSWSLGVSLSIAFTDEVRTCLLYTSHFYNHRRPHMSIGYKIPAVAHLEKGIQKKMSVSYKHLTLTGAIIPVWLGSALAFSDGQVKTAPALLCALFACGMQIAANFINDLFDFQKGRNEFGKVDNKAVLASSDHFFYVGVYVTLGKKAAYDCLLYTSRCV